MCAALTAKAKVATLCDKFELLLQRSIVLEALRCALIYLFIVETEQAHGLFIRDAFISYKVTESP